MAEEKQRSRKQEGRRAPLTEITPGRLARAMWAETTLKDKPDLEPRQRKQLWKGEKERYVELCRAILERLKQRAGEDEAELEGEPSSKPR
jgi:hypothetical protein